MQDFRKNFSYSFLNSMKVSAINYISFNGRAKQELKTQNNQQSILSVDLNNQPISEVNKSLVKRKYAELLKPQYIHAQESRFPESCLTTQYKTHYNFIQQDKETGNIIFRKELNPQKLPYTNGKFKGYEISNFHNPSGSIAIQTRLKSTLSTSGLYQCAAVSFVDRKNNLQTLLHLCPMADKKSNLLLLDYLTSNCNKDNLEISIVAGCDTYTDDTITLLMSFIKEKCPTSKVNFMDYPNVYDDQIVLNNGNLQCIGEDGKFETMAINPYSKIIYA